MMIILRIKKASVLGMEICFEIVDVYNSDRGSYKKKIV